MKKNQIILLLLVAAIVGVGAFAMRDHQARAQVARVWSELTTTPARADTAPAGRRTFVPKGKWDGTVVLTDSQRERIGLRLAGVEPQTEPTPLRLSGTTDYDPATLTIVRVQFDSRVDKVLVDLGAIVKTGDPVLELFSADLAEAKSLYETAVNQWVHDKKILDYRAPLAKTDALPRKELIEIENDEAQSALKMKLAKDKLLLYGLTEKEIEAAKSEDGVRKARMTLRSRGNGIVIKRAVVRGNYYDAKDELMTIAPLDHLWVRGSVSEIDAEKVQVGQDLKVVFPYASGRTIPGRVQYVDKAIDPESRSAKFRTSIPNPDGELKAGTFVRVLLDLPPVPGRTVIPREAMVTVDRHDFVFIRKAGSPGAFERREIVVAKEGNDRVIVAQPTRQNPGLKPGEEVVTSGSLILEQMYEDRVTMESGVVL